MGLGAGSLGGGNSDRHGSLFVALCGSTVTLWRASGLSLTELGPFGADLGDQFLGLPTGGTIPGGDDADSVLAHQVLEIDLGLGSAILGSMGIDDPVF